MTETSVQVIVNEFRDLRLTEAQVTVIRETIAKDLTPAELSLYFYFCREQGAHPLSRLIYPIKYGGRLTFVSSIDYLRARAGATGEHAGTDDAVISGVVGSRDYKASVTVWRLVNGQRCAFTHTARFGEYKPQSNPMWDKMPAQMLAKTAEAGALRKGFPVQLDKLYIPEEMAQASEKPVGPLVVEPAAPEFASQATPAQLQSSGRTITDKQLKRLWAICKAAGATEAQVKAYLAKAHGLMGVKAIPMSLYDTVISQIEAGLPTE